MEMEKELRKANKNRKQQEGEELLQGLKNNRSTEKAHPTLYPKISPSLVHYSQCCVSSNTAMTDITSHLPVEMLESIFQHLSIHDLQTVVSVCRRWREVGEVPCLWSSLPIMVRSSKLSRLEETLSKPRLQAAKKVIIALGPVREQVLEFVLTHPRMASLWETLDMTNCRLDGEQVNKVFAAIIRDSKLKNLMIGYNDLSFLEPGVLGRAVTKLQTLEVTNISHSQGEEILRALSQTSKLKTLILETLNLNLDSLDPSLLAGAATWVETLDIEGNFYSGTQISPSMAETVFKAISQPSRLRNLLIAHNDLSLVQPAILARAGTSLHTLDVSYTQLTQEQVEAIFSNIILGSKLRDLSVKGVNLSTSDPKLLVRAVNKLQRVNIDCTSLTCEQGTGILTQSVVLTSLVTLKMEDVPGIDQDIVTEAKLKYELIIMGWNC